uniref:Uncharacterized protein n=1 Tax=viral metagenome TaxID=1070528 RepID=A0A2V0RCN7_9ZZZZ
MRDSIDAVIIGSMGVGASHFGRQMGAIELDQIAGVSDKLDWVIDRSELPEHGAYVVGPTEFEPQEWITKLNPDVIWFVTTTPDVYRKICELKARDLDYEESPDLRDHYLRASRITNEAFFYFQISVREDVLDIARETDALVLRFVNCAKPEEIEASWKAEKITEDVTADEKSDTIN